MITGSSLSCDFNGVTDDLQLSVEIMVIGSVCDGEICELCVVSTTTLLHMGSMILWTPAAL